MSLADFNLFLWSRPACVDPPVYSSLQVCARKLSELTFTIITTLHFITTHGERNLLYKCTRHIYSNGTKRLEQQNAPKKPNKQKTLAGIKE